MLSILLSNKILKAVEFRIQGKKIVVEKLAQLNFENDIFDPDKIDLAVAEVKSFFETNSIAPQKTIFALSHYDIVSRELVLPFLSRKEAESIIVNEIERAPRFSKNPFVFAYQMHEYPFDRNVKVIYYVFQRSFLETAESVLKLAGCLPIAVEICPLSLLNANVKQKEEGVLIFLDDKSSHLMVCRGQECMASYLLNVGSENLSSKNSNEVESATLNLANDIKKILENYYAKDKPENIFVSFAGNYPVEEGFFQRLSSLSKYECGPFCFDEKNIDLPAETSMKEISHEYSPVIGSIFRLLGSKHSFNVENLWDIRKTKPSISKFYGKLVSAAAVCLLCGMIFVLPLKKKAHDLKFLALKLQKQAQALEKDMAELTTKQKAFERIKFEFVEQSKILNQARLNSWRDVLNDINDNIPKDVWVKRVSQDRGNTVVIEGGSLDLDSIAHMIDNLKNDKRLENIRLLKTDDYGKDDDNFFTFTLNSSFPNKKVIKE